MTIKAALLDENGVFLRMDELADESALTDRHLPQITSFDHPSGTYRWVGDHFDSIARREAVEKTKREAAEAEVKKQRGIMRRGRIL